MLARAYAYKEALSRQLIKAADDPYYDNLWAEGWIGFNIEVRDDTYYKHQFVSLDSVHNVIGYLDASIDRSTNSINNIIIANFQKKDNITFAKDLKDFFLRIFLRYNYRKVSFSVVVGSRNEKIYDKFIGRYGGRTVGVFCQHRRLQDGSISDMKYYEIMREDFIKKARLLHPKQIHEDQKD